MLWLMAICPLKLIFDELKCVLSRLQTMQQLSKYYFLTDCSFLISENVSTIMARIKAKNIW